MSDDKKLDHLIGVLTKQRLMSVAGEDILSPAELLVA